ncbi:MAG: hypothetical protein AB1668_05215 [Nanoarchaeota archaeon]
MLINNKVLDEKKVTALITRIKKKKELKEVSSDFVYDCLFDFLQQNPKLVPMLTDNFNPKSSYYKQIIKEVRARLRKVYGLFRVEEGAKHLRVLVSELLESGKSKQAGKNKHKELITRILSTHASTKERLPFYSQLYKKIFALTGKPETIIDFGCGINPFSVHFMELKKITYYAYDISEDEIRSLQLFFKHEHAANKNFTGRAKVMDVFQWVRLKESRENAPADICFLFKMTDILDSSGKGHKTSGAVIAGVPAKYVVVSFPTKTMSGKKMNFPRRKWIELMCARLGYSFWILEFGNEVFYVIKKHPNTDSGPNTAPALPHSCRKYSLNPQTGAL